MKEVHEVRWVSKCLTGLAKFGRRDRFDRARECLGRHILSKITPRWLPLHTTSQPNTWYMP